MKKILFIVASLRKQSFNREISERVRGLLEGKAEVKELEAEVIKIVRTNRAK